MENLIQIASVPAITSAVYGIIQLYKTVIKGNEKLTQIIPILAVILGAVIGIVLYYVTESFLPAENIITAILIGGASGLAATGGNQIFKQLSKDKTENKQEEKPDDSDEK